MMRNTVGFLLFLASLLFAFGVLVPKFQELRDITIQKEATLQAVDLQKKRMAGLTTLKGVFAQQANRVATIISILPSDPGYGSALLALEAIVRESGVSVQSYNPQSRPGDKVVVVAIQGEGDLVQIEKFAQALAEHSRPISLGAALLSRQESGNVSFQFTLVMPYGTQGGEQ